MNRLNNHRLKTNLRLRTTLIATLCLAGTLLAPSGIYALSISDPTALPFANTLGLGVDFTIDSRKLDDLGTVGTYELMAKVHYSLMDEVGLYVKGGLFRTETYSGKTSDFGPAFAIGVKGYFIDWEDPDLRVGADIQVMFGKADHSSDSRALGRSTDEEISWIEYAITPVVSWLAYDPLVLYTGLQLSQVKTDYDIETYNWLSGTTIKQSYDSNEDQMLGLFWGVTYNVMDTFQIFGEMRALSEISGSFGMNFHF